MLLGVSGSGKTSFLNLLANIGKVNETGDPNLMFQTSVVNEHRNENYVSGSTISKTSDVVKYKLQIGHATFTFIDTPGFGYTREMKFDHEKAQKIR